MRSAQKRVFAALLVVIGVSFPSSPCWAIFELGVSGSYRKSFVDTDAYDEAQSLTGSASWYVGPSSAIEISYTDGASRRVIGEGQATGHSTNMYYRMLGVDLVLTLAGDGAIIKPYIKGGAAYIFEKKIVDQYRDKSGPYPATEIKDDPGLVPSAGAGFRISLTQTLSLKVGIEGWSSRPLNKQPATIDYVARVGLSWLL